jgi:hypothetical protein
VLPVEAIEGGRRRGPVTALQLSLSQVEEGLGREGRAAGDRLLESGLGFASAFEDLGDSGKGPAPHGAPRLAGRGEIGAHRGVHALEAVLGPGRREQGVVAERGALDVAVSEVNESLLGALVLEEQQARGQARESSGHAPGVPLGHGPEGGDALGVPADGGGLAEGLLRGARG